MRKFQHTTLFYCKISNTEVSNQTKLNYNQIIYLLECVYRQSLSFKTGSKKLDLLFYVDNLPENLYK